MSRGGATKAYPDGRYVEELQRRRSQSDRVRSRNKGFEAGSKSAGPPSAGMRKSSVNQREAGFITRDILNALRSKTFERIFP